MKMMGTVITGDIGPAGLLTSALRPILLKKPAPSLAEMLGEKANMLNLTVPELTLLVG